jgi:hypothetical protein
MAYAGDGLKQFREPMDCCRQRERVRTMAERFTFMAGHGHPDDECRRTGGVLVRYARAGIRTVSHVPVDGPADDLLAGLRAVL